ncbi:hypothetical protein ACJ72_05322 [Emergomyces africanus]|uniref:CDP-diacylglycerol--glycerol-3-phosphate 3-phosphatidyltransferase n=1 Tax=Emergomyces africanus TaxID=1955775 RepID=A0A1B7NU98_9EURO|nr:hypothetical protein ACJ72_05322 [Emergomyces africanus]
MTSMSLLSLSWASRVSSQSPRHCRLTGSALWDIGGTNGVNSRLAYASTRSYCLSRLCHGSNVCGGFNQTRAAISCPEEPPKSREFSTFGSKSIYRGQVIPHGLTPSGRRFLSTEPPSGKFNDDKNQTNSGTASKTSRLLSRLPLPAHENIYTIPNILTFSRLAAAPVIGYCILHSYDTLALSLFAYASITDLLDGYIARKFNQQTVVGTVIDPMADKPS